MPMRPEIEIITGGILAVDGEPPEVPPPEDPVTPSKETPPAPP